MNRVVVYGSLKKGFHNSSLLEDCTCLSNEVTFQGDMFSLGAFPFCTKGGNNTIYGEMYEVDDSVMSNLDKLEGHPEFYRREVVETSEGPAWVYFIYSSEYDGVPVPSGRWANPYVGE